MSRWVNVPAVAMWAVAVFVSSTSDETMSSKDAIREVQQPARAGLGAMVSGSSSCTTLVGHVTKDSEDLLRVGPGTSKGIKARLMVCAHMKDAGRRGVVATLQRIEGGRENPTTTGRNGAQDET